ncbi:MAG: hypothetical protein MUQ10_15855, partial [Anaerolineae bacterium]|nr:hypothetical protein [Anaerolineae bacterium]
MNTDSETDMGQQFPGIQSPLSFRRIAAVWWPLALSWLLMSVEGPAHSAVVARLANAEINLAAWGGIVFPIALIVESPAIMMLSASTALSKDWDTYRKLRRIAMVLGAALTVIHIAVAFTPIYYVVARDLIGAPEAIIEPGRLGLMIMTPWSWAIAYRRFQQGAMIRFGHSKAVGTGTVIRMVANAAVLAIGFVIHDIPGIIVAASAVAVGVITEALYAGLRVRPIVRIQIRCAPRSKEPLTIRSFAAFYVPLALTSLIWYFVSPIGSAAMSRMPNPLGSLAAWPVLSGLIFMLRSPGLAYNEAVVALLDEKDAYRRLKRFCTGLGVGSLLLTVVVVATPLATLWFDNVMALSPALVELGKQALWPALPLSLLAVLQSWYQGTIVHSRHTRGVTESVVLYLVVTAIVMGIGIATQRFPGLAIAIFALDAAVLAQVGWLW